MTSFRWLPKWIIIRKNTYFPNWALNQWEHKFKHPNQSPMTTTSTSTTQQVTTTRTATTNTRPQLLLLTSQTLLIGSKDFAKEGTYRCTSKAQTLLGHPWSTLKTRTIKQNKQE